MVKASDTCWWQWVPYTKMTNSNPRWDYKDKIHTSLPTEQLVVFLRVSIIVY